MRTRLYETYTANGAPVDDPNNPGIYTQAYDVLSWFWDATTRTEVLAEPGVPVGYTGGYAGAPSNPYDYSFLLSAGSQVDQYLMPSNPTAPGYDAAAVGQVRTVLAAGSANPGRVVFTDAPAPALALVGVLGIAPVGGQSSGRVEAGATGGVPPYGFDLDGAPPVGLSAGQPYWNPAPGPYSVRVRDAAMTEQTQVVVVPAGPAPACDNPDADNYNTGENTYPAPAVCVFSPKLTMAAPPALGALGRPLWANLSSAAVAWSTPSAATGTVTLASPAPGTLLLVNGYRFVVGPPTTPDQFQDGPTLAAALLGVPALAAAYHIVATGTGAQLTARAWGPAGNLALTSSATGLTLASTAGQPLTHSQRRAAWGCWLEVWALPTLAYRGSLRKVGAVLADRFEARYREDNAYAFDIAAGLRAFTGLRYDCADRLIGYFLRYGETYADTAGGYRRIRPAVGETAVRFGLEAVEVVPVGGDGRRVLTARPGPWGVVDGQFAALAVLPEAGPGVVQVPYVGPTEPPQRADAPALAFANGQGGRDTVLFEGVREEIHKRTASAYTTATGRQTQRAELPAAFRLHSGLLLRTEWAWLCRELGNSPAVWLETSAGPVPVNLTALTPADDELKGEYSVAVECEFCEQPNLGLTA